MTLEEKIDYLKRQVKFHLTMEEFCVDSFNLHPDLQVAENGVTHKEIAEMLQEELGWLEELRTMKESLEIIRDQAIEDCASVVADILQCRDCPIDGCRYIYYEPTDSGCKESIKFYLQEKLEGGREDAGSV